VVSTRAWILPLACTMVDCVPPAPPSVVPMREVRLGTSGAETGRCLVVVLPGLNTEPEELVEGGLPQIIGEAGVAADVVIPEAHFGYYADHTLIERVDEDLVEPAFAAGYAHVWLVGISLGGLGVLAYGTAHPERIAGIILLSPYLGRGEVLDEIDDYGGARAWRRARSRELDRLRLGRRFLRGDDASFYRAVWSFAAEPRRRDGTEVPIYLGYGRWDFLVDDQRLLETAIPERRRLVAWGGHHIGVYRDVLRAFARQGFLQRSCGKVGARAALAFGISVG
jgi:hypothetical protein